MPTSVVTMGGTPFSVAFSHSSSMVVASMQLVDPEAMMIDRSPSDGWLSTYDSAVCPEPHNGV